MCNSESIQWWIVGSLNVFQIYAHCDYNHPYSTSNTANMFKSKTTITWFSQVPFKCRLSNWTVWLFWFGSSDNSQRKCIFSPSSLLLGVSISWKCLSLSDNFGAPIAVAVKTRKYTFIVSSQLKNVTQCFILH